MSQHDLVAELRGTRLTAPLEVRERVRAIAATARPAERRFLRRRSLVLLIPVAAAIAGTIVLTRPGAGPRPTPIAVLGAPPTSSSEGAVTRSAAPTVRAAKSYAPVPSSTRAQRYSATIGLRVASAAAVSSAVKQALRITAALGGHPTAVNASAAAKTGSAELVLRIPRSKVQEAVTRLSQLGTITSEDVSVQDLQATIDATGRKIARLQTRLSILRAEPETTQRDKSIASITRQIERLQRGRAATERSAALATVRLHVATAAPVVPPTHRHGPLHGIGVAAYWAGIGAVYALAIGLPLVVLLGIALLAGRAVRRRRVDALLSRP